MVPNLPQTLAANLRRLRIARRLSLSELARATGLSKATLSGIESARANPTVETLANLAAALRVSVVELPDEIELGEVSVNRAVSARFGTRDGLEQRALEGELTEIRLDAGQTRETQAKPAGTRIGLYLLEGSLIAGPVERSTELSPGDYLSFPADVPHTYATARHPARALAITRTDDAAH
jgi:transcriptional regulator with XRE-family HTH domain